MKALYHPCQNDIFNTTSPQEILTTAKKKRDFNFPVCTFLSNTLEMLHDSHPPPYFQLSFRRLCCQNMSYGKGKGHWRWQSPYYLAMFQQ